MELNLFYSLFKYSPSLDREPLENFFTEMIGFLFDFDKELSSKWISEISGGILNPNPDGMKVFTQYSLGEFGRADLAVFWTESEIRNSVLIEHKIRSTIGERGKDETGETKTQIDQYLRYQREKGDANNHKVVLFKVSPLPIYLYRSHHFLGEFTWNKFYKFLIKFINKRHKIVHAAVTEFLAYQIMTFMRRHNMVFENFTVQDLASLDPYSEFKKKRNKLAETIIAQFKPASKSIKEILGFSSDAWGADNLGKHWGLILHNKKKCDGSTIWVHIGFSLLAEESVWFPLITMDKQKIPDIQVMLGLWPTNLEKAKHAYGNIHEKLNANLCNKGESEGQFEAIDGKKYICFSFRKPLSDFLKYEDQESTVIKFLEVGLNGINKAIKTGILSKIVNDENFKE